jgi:hypothetical protein
LKDQDMGDTAGMWAKMLGIDGLLAIANDPNFQGQIHAFVAAIADTQQRVARVELKLDQIAAQLGVEINGQSAAGSNGGFAAVSVQHGPVGTGGPSPTTGAGHDGTRQGERPIARLGNGSRVA